MESQAPATGDRFKSFTTCVLQHPEKLETKFRQVPFRGTGRLLRPRVASDDNAGSSSLSFRGQWLYSKAKKNFIETIGTLRSHTIHNYTNGTKDPDERAFSLHVWGNLSYGELSFV